jgi:hypothetical protein
LKLNGHSSNNQNSRHASTLGIFRGDNDRGTSDGMSQQKHPIRADRFRRVQSIFRILSILLPTQARLNARLYLWGKSKGIELPTGKKREWDCDIALFALA